MAGIRKMVSGAALLAACAMAAPSQAMASEGWYARAGAGFGTGGEADISADAPLGGDASLEESDFAEVAVGYARADGWRFDAGVLYWESNIEAGPLLDPGGSLSVTGLMAGVYRDFGDGPLRPYVGARIGLADVGLTARYTPPLNPAAIDDNAVTFAYELDAGVAIALTSRLQLDVGYRYFAAPGFEGKGAAPPSTSIDVDADIATHAWGAGLRWSF